MTEITTEKGRGLENKREVNSITVDVEDHIHERVIDMITMTIAYVAMTDVTNDQMVIIAETDPSHVITITDVKHLTTITIEADLTVVTDHKGSIMDAMATTQMTVVGITMPIVEAVMIGPVTEMTDQTAEAENSVLIVIDKTMQVTTPVLDLIVETIKQIKRYNLIRPCL